MGFGSLGRLTIGRLGASGGGLAGWLASIGALLWRRNGTTHALRDQHGNYLK